MDFTVNNAIFASFFVFFCLTTCHQQGNLRPEEALQSLTIYEGNFSRLKVEREKCARAKEALDLTDTGLFSASEERVQVKLCFLALTLIIFFKIKIHVLHFSFYLVTYRLPWKSCRT